MGEGKQNAELTQLHSTGTCKADDPPDLSLLAGKPPQQPGAQKPPMPVRAAPPQQSFKVGALLGHLSHRLALAVETLLHRTLQHSLQTSAAIAAAHAEQALCAAASGCSWSQHPSGSLGAQCPASELPCSPHLTSPVPGGPSQCTCQLLSAN